MRAYELERSRVTPKLDLLELSSWTIFGTRFAIASSEKLQSQGELGIAGSAISVNSTAGKESEDGSLARPFSDAIVVIAHNARSDHTSGRPCSAGS